MNWGVQADRTAKVFYGLLDCREAQAASRNLFIALQLLKGLKDQVVILLGYSRTIVRNLKDDGRSFLPPPDENSPIGAIVVLNGVVDEIAQDKVERRPRRQD